MRSQNPLETADIARTASLFGGARVLRRPVRSRLEAHDLLRQGLPSGALHHLVTKTHMLRETPHATGALEKAVGISLRTYQRHREMPDRRLSPEQSGRAWKFAEILGRAIDLFGAREEAEAWLNRPAMALDGRCPLDLLSSPAGVQSVEDHLTRIEYGVYT